MARGPAWPNRPTSPATEPLLWCSLFAGHCRRSGDLRNAYRWRCVLQENRRDLEFKARQIPLP